MAATDGWGNLKKKTFDTHTRWCTGIWFYSYQLNPNLLISGIWPQCKHTSSNLMFMIGDQTSEIKIFSNKQKSTKIHAMARLRPGCFRWHWYLGEWVSCFLPEARLHQRWAQIDKKNYFITNYKYSTCSSILTKYNTRIIKSLREMGQRWEGSELNPGPHVYDIDTSTNCPPSPTLIIILRDLFPYTLTFRKFPVPEYQRLRSR